jgi:hypothetical protein
MSTLITKGLLGPKLVTQGYSSASYEYVKRNVLQVDYSRVVLQADYSRTVLQIPKESD